LNARHAAHRVAHQSAHQVAHHVAHHVDYRAVSNIRTASIVLGLLVCVFAAGASWLSLRDEHARQLKSHTALAELGAQALDGYLLSLQSALQLMSAEILDRDNSYDQARAESVVRRMKAAYPELRIVTVARLDGTVIATSERTAPSPGVSMAARQTFIEARDERLATGNRNLTIGRAFLGPVSHEWVIPLGYGVWTMGGKLAYILGAGLPLSKPQDFWKDAPLPANAALGLVRDDGFLLSRYPLPANSKLEEIYGKAASGTMGTFVLENGRSARGLLAGASKITGEETLFVYRRLSGFPLTFYIATPASNVLSEWWDRVWAAWLLLFFLLLAALHVYRWAVRRQTAWERERAQQIAMLKTANQELEDFAYTVAHDLKSPARAIDGHAGIAIESLGASLPEGLGHRLTQIRRNAARMGQLIDDLLEFSRYLRTTLARRKVDMEALVRDVAADALPADGGVELVVGPLPPCEADPALLRVVLTVLVSNAVKYSAREKSPAIEIGFAGGKYFVRDNGVGFDMAHSEKLFAVFSRLHGADEFEGTGAGLAIARRILERHGGSIAAEAAPGRGAVFSFTVAAPDAFPEKESKLP
jgi:signal transduction histidine kinase